MLKEILIDNAPIIIASIPGIVASIALWLNKRTHDKDVRNQNYRIIESLDNEFRKIELESVKIEEARLKKNIIEKILEVRKITYEWDFIRFHEKIAYLSNKNIIPKYAALFYKHTFSDALMFLEKNLDKDTREKAYTELYKYVSKNKIKSTFEQEDTKNITTKINSKSNHNKISWIVIISAIVLSFSLAIYSVIFPVEDGKDMAGYFIIMGLIFDIAGVTIILIPDLANKVKRITGGGAIAVISRQTVGSVDRYQYLARGFFLLVIGFLFQIIGNFFSN